MASIDTTRHVSAPALSLGSYFAGLIAAVQAWNDARVTRNTLERLSDRELEDIGLCRGDIEGIANGGGRA
ncbi:MAG: DUF1127 domain-containing protein [Rubellimicrobium sp.]|nr:DUF1127 domain-containing protein [Rubellimicrobium sp.]